MIKFHNNSYKGFLLLSVMELICLLSKDEGSWAQVSGLMKHGDWEKIVLIGGEEAKSFGHEKNFEFIKIDLDKKLKGKFEGMEAACSIASGCGKEHMALVSGLLGLPMGVRFVALTKDGIVWL